MGIWEGVKEGGCPSWVLVKAFMRGFFNLMDLLQWPEGGKVTTFPLLPPRSKKVVESRKISSNPAVVAGTSIKCETMLKRKSDLSEREDQLDCA